MPFGDDLRAHLAVAPITGTVADRIEPMVRKQFATLPAISYVRVSGTPTNSLAGAAGDCDNFRVQIDCWASTYKAARDLADLVRTRMNTAASTFRAVCINLPEDLFEPDTRTFRVMQEFSCWYTP